MRESAISSQKPIQEIVDDGLMSLGMDNVESLAYLPDQSTMKRMIRKARQKAINPTD